MRANRDPGMGGNHGALGLEQEKNIVRLIAERLEIALPLGKNQVRLCESPFEFLAAVVKKARSNLMIASRGELRTASPGGTAFPARWIKRLPWQNKKSLPQVNGVQTLISLC